MGFGATVIGDELAVVGLQVLGLEHLHLLHPPQPGGERTGTVRPGFRVIFALPRSTRASRSHPGGPEVITSVEVEFQAREFVAGWLRELRGLNIGDVPGMVAATGACRLKGARMTCAVLVLSVHQYLQQHKLRTLPADAVPMCRLSLVTRPSWESTFPDDVLV